MIGNRTKVKVVKNKVAPPFREAEFDLMYGTGISIEGDLADLAITHRLIEKSGTWFTVGEERMQGRENLKKYIKENPDIKKRLEAKIRQVTGLVKDEKKTESPNPNATKSKTTPVKANQR